MARDRRTGSSHMPQLHGQLRRAEGFRRPTVEGKSYGRQFRLLNVLDDFNREGLGNLQPFGSIGEEVFVEGKRHAVPLLPC